MAHMQTHALQADVQIVIMFILEHQALAASHSVHHDPQYETAWQGSGANFSNDLCEGAAWTATTQKGL